MTRSFKRNEISNACLLALASTLPCSALANETENSEDKVKNEVEMEVIEVQGVRSSILKSLKNKRFAQEILDTISAEDLGQLPDENIAEALSRINGVSLSRAEDGEGQSVQIRGDSSNNIEMNGQTMVGSGENPRSINFQDIPSELFSTIEVLKASTADRIEGSLGGTINLKTQKPLNLKNNSLASVTLKAKHNELAEHTSPDVTVFKANNFRDTAIGDFGFLLTLSAKEVVSQDEAFGTATWNGAPSRWTVYTGLSGASSASQFGADKAIPFDSNLDPNGDGVSDENDIFYVPNQWKVYSNNKTSKRGAVNLTLQWQPTSTSSFWLNGSVSRRDDLIANSSFSMQANTGTAGGNQWDPANVYRSFPLPSENTTFELVNSTEVGDFYVMTAGRMGGINTVMGSSPAVRTEIADSYQITLGGELILGDYLTMDAEVASSSSVSEREQSQLLLTHDYTGNGRVQNNDFAAVLDFNEIDTDLAWIKYYDAPLNTAELKEIDPSLSDFDRLAYRQLQRNATDIKNTSNSAKLDFQYEFDSAITSVQFGYRYADRSAERINYMGNSTGNGEGIYDNGRLIIPHLSGTPVNDESNEVSIALSHCLQPEQANLEEFSGNIPLTWIGTTCDSAFIESYFNLPNIRAINPNTGDPYYQRNGQRYNNVDIKEKTEAAYIRANFFTSWLGTDIDFVGNLGVRYVTTQVTGIGWIDAQDESDSNYQQVEVTSEYEHALPSLNFNWLLSDEIVLRLAWSKNIARPNLNQVSPSFNLNYVEDLGTEGYVGTGRAGNIGLKPRTAENVDLSYEWYYDDDALLSIAIYYKEINDLVEQLSGQDLIIGDERFLVQQWQNVGSTYIKGVELGWQQSFGFLPGFLADTGVNFNYTHPVESETLIDGQGDGLVKEGHSDHNVNATFYYDNKTFSVRLAYSYRSEYVRDYQATLGYARTEDPYRIPQYVDAYGQVDLSANLKITKKLKLNFNVTNLTNEHSTWYLKHKQMTDRLSYTGRRANLSIQYKF